MVLAALVLLGAVCAAGLIGFVYYKETHLPPVGEFDTIIVLGAQVKADGTPSVALERRLTAALEEYRAAGTVFAFAGTVHEIDTALLLKETLAAGKTLVLPRCAEGHALDLCVVTSMDELVPGMYGILEPKADCALVTPADIDFAVVPCLSFDRRGRRLGQGGGYYDRLLPQLACPTCLICRERLMSEAVPTEEHDRRCTLYVTERGVMEPET